MRSSIEATRSLCDQSRPSHSAQNGFTEGFDTLDPIEAKALLEELGG
jgi:hypothetical protein